MVGELALLLLQLLVFCVLSCARCKRRITVHCKKDKLVEPKEDVTQPTERSKHSEGTKDGTGDAQPPPTPFAAGEGGELKMPEPFNVLEHHQRPIGFCLAPEQSAASADISIDKTQQETKEEPVMEKERPREPEEKVVDGSELTEEERRKRKKERKRTLKPVPRAKKLKVSERSDGTQRSLTPDQISLLPTSHLAQSPTKGVLKTSNSVLLPPPEAVTEDEDFSQKSMGTYSSRRSVRFAAGTILGDDETQLSHQ